MKTIHLIRKPPDPKGLVHTIAYIGVGGLNIDPLRVNDGGGAVHQ